MPGATAVPAEVTKTLKGYIVAQYNDGEGVTLRFLENDKLPKKDDLASKLAETDGYIVERTDDEFVFSKGEEKFNFKTINLGKLPTTEELDKDVEASEGAVSPADFFKNKNVQALIANSKTLKGRSGKINGWGYDFTGDGEGFKIGEFVPMTGAGRRRRKGAAALACMAVMRRRKPAPKLKPLGREVTRDGKERTVYLMGRAKVVRMRPGGCKRAVIVRVSDITKKGVRGWGPRSGW